MSRREIDSRGEKALGVFLDTYFYSKTQERRILEYARRIYSKEMQKKGINLLLGDKCKIDEKAQLYYINKPLKSFAFEIDYYEESSDGIVDGWFINKNNETNDYLLIWIHEARTTHINRLVAEDFLKVEANLIEKEHIKEYIRRFGLSDAELKQKAIEMRNKKIKRVDIDSNCHLTYSYNKGDYSEIPINLVINKQALDELSEKRFMITKECVEVL